MQKLLKKIETNILYAYSKQRNIRYCVKINNMNKWIEKVKSNKIIKN